MALTFTGEVTVAGELTSTITPIFAANAVNFDGTNDYLTRGGDLTGSADNKTAIISFWFKPGVDGVGSKLFNNTSSFMKIEKNTSNVIEFVVTDDAGSTTAWSFTTNETVLLATGWTHFLLGYDTAAGGTHTLYLNDTLATFASETFNVDTVVDHTRSEWSVGAAHAGGEKANGDMADFYFTNEFLDMTVESNRRKFIDASGKPVNLGSDGSTPTGTAALIFLSGDTSTWHTNDGTGGGFTENGALTDASTSPSD